MLHPRHPAAAHHDARLRRADVAGAALQTGPLPGADGQRQGAAQQFAVIGHRRGLGPQGEVVLPEPAFGQRLNDDLAVVQGGTSRLQSGGAA